MIRDNQQEVTRN